MAIPSRQIGWGTTDNLLWEISKQIESIGCVVACGTSSTGTSGTSGASGLSGTSGTSGVVGTSGTSGQSGTAGVNGTSGITGTSGVSGTSGTSPVFPFPTVFGLYAQTADSVDVTNTTTETTLIGSGVGTLTVGANQFAVGDSFRADLAGVMGAQNNSTLRIRIKAGSIILVDSGFQNLGSAISADVWSLSVNFTVRAVGAAGVASVATLGTFNFTKTNNGTVEGFSFNTLNNTTFDTTISNTLGITVEWGTANIENTIYSDIFVLNKIY